MWLTLDDVADLTKGKHCQKTDGNIPIIGSGKKPTGYTDKANTGDDTITISTKGTVGKIYRWRKPIWASETCLVVDPKPMTLKDYLYHYLKKHEREIQEFHNCQTIVEIDMSRLRKLPVFVPDRYTQADIVADLERLALDISHIDKKIKAVNDLGKAMAASLLNFEQVGSTTVNKTKPIKQIDMVGL